MVWAGNSPVVKADYERNGEAVHWECVRIREISIRSDTPSYRKGYGGVLLRDEIARKMSLLVGGTA